MITFPRDLPRTFHHIWVGNKPLPDKYKGFIEGCKKLHPTWEFRFWDNEAVKGLRLQNQHYYDISPNPAMKSDILRLELMYQFGGIYLDCDCEVVKPFETILDQVLCTCEAFLGDEYRSTDGSHHCCNAVIGSVKEGSWLKPILNAIPHAYVMSHGGRHFDSTMATAGPWFLDRFVYGNPKVHLFHNAIFYARIQHDPRSIVRHHYDGVWLGKQVK